MGCGCRGRRRNAWRRIRLRDVSLRSGMCPRCNGTVLWRVFLLLNRSHKAIPASMQRLNAALGLSTVAHGPAHSHQTGVQAPIPNELVGPELLEQLVFRDDPLAMANQVDQDLKDLWP